MGFFAPWFLAGLLGVGLPIWLHLLRRHKTEPKPFASLMFFERRTQSSVKHRRLLYKWRDQLEPMDDGQAPPENSKERELRLQVGQLKRLVADKTLEADFFKGALQKVEARRQSNKQAGETASMTKSGN